MIYGGPMGARFTEAQREGYQTSPFEAIPGEAGARQTKFMGFLNPMRHGDEAERSRAVEQMYQDLEFKVRKIFKEFGEDLKISDVEQAAHDWLLNLLRINMEPTPPKKKKGSEEVSSQYYDPNKAPFWGFIHKIIPMAAKQAANRLRSDPTHSAPPDEGPEEDPEKDSERAPGQKKGPVGNYRPDEIPSKSPRKGPAKPEDPEFRGSEEPEDRGASEFSDADFAYAEVLKKEIIKKMTSGDAETKRGLEILAGYYGISLNRPLTPPRPEELADIWKTMSREQKEQELVALTSVPPKMELSKDEIASYAKMAMQSIPPYVRQPLVASLQARDLAARTDIRLSGPEIQKRYGIKPTDFKKFIDDVVADLEKGEKSAGRGEQFDSLLRKLNHRIVSTAGKDMRMMLENHLRNISRALCRW